jgi:hypothetical protein
MLSSRLRSWSSVLCMALLMFGVLPIDLVHACSHDHFSQEAPPDAPIIEGESICALCDLVMPVLMCDAEVQPLTGQGFFELRGSCGQGPLDLGVVERGSARAPPVVS